MAKEKTIDTGITDSSPEYVKTTISSAKLCREDMFSGNAKTRPRPQHEPAQEEPQMEEIHAEFLDKYHREALQQSEDDAQSVSNTIVETKENICSSSLSETSASVSEESSAPNSAPPAGSPAKRVTPLQRTESVDRRLNEAARFYQAVGEKPPTSESDIIQRIIEDDQHSESDSDDDATIHHVAASDESPSNFEKPVENELQSFVDAVVKPSLKKLYSYSQIFHKLPSDKEIHSDGFHYKGISNPPEITKRGLSRGNYALLHRKAWLEVSDERHRYGKNLRLYYREWESLGHPTNDFFDWLDSKNASAGEPLPELADCPRSELDSDTVLYILDSEVTKQYSLSLVCDRDGRARVLDGQNNPVLTGPEGWIFVLRDNVLYGTEKVTSVSEHARQRFHHSSFFGGKAVAAAGIITTDDNGFLSMVLPHSGHYRPGEADMQRMLFYMYSEGVDLRLIEVDVQLINHINRKDSKTMKKKAKKDSLHLRSAATVANFLSHKARFIGQGIFKQLRLLEKMDAVSVKEAVREMNVQVVEN